MSSALGEAFVRLRSDDTGYRTEVSRQVTRSVGQVERALGGSNRELSRFSRGAIVGTGALGGLGRAAAFASTSFIGGAGLVYALKTASGAASALTEQTSRSSVVFRDSAGVIQAWSKTSAAALGLARDQAVGAASEFGTLFVNIGRAPQEAARFSTSIVQLGADLASFADTPVPDALRAIRSGLTGEIEPLRRYGVFLSEAATQQDALTFTGKKSVDQLTTQDRVLSRMRQIFAQTSLAQGDFARTSEGLANQQRTLTANIRDFEAAIGRGLNPALEELLPKINAYLGDAKNQEEITKRVTGAVRTLTSVAEGLAAGLEDVHDATAPLVEAVGGLDDAIRLLIIGMAVAKIAKFTGALGLIAPAAASAATVSTAASAIEATGSAAAIATGRVALLRGALLRLGALGLITVGISVILNRDSIQKSVDDFLDAHGIPGGGTDLTPEQLLSQRKNLEKTFGKAQIDALIKKVFPTTGNIGDAASRGEGPITPGAAGTTGQGAAGNILSTVLSAAARRRIALAQNAGTGSQAEVSAIREQIAADRRAIAFAEQMIRERRGNTAKFAEQLEGLYSDLRSREDRIAAITAEGEARIADARQRAQDAREKALAAAKKARERQLAAEKAQREQGRRDAVRAIRDFKDASGGLAVAGGPLAVENGFVMPASQVDKFRARLESLQRTPDALSLQTQIAEQRSDDEQKLIPFLDKERRAAERRLGILRKLGGTQEQILQATLNLETIKRRIRDIRASSAAKSGYTLDQLFAEASSQFATYGGNIGERGDSLSGQDARASVKGSLDKVRGDTIIVQNFHGERNASQAIWEAANAARALK